MATEPSRLSRDTRPLPILEGTERQEQLLASTHTLRLSRYVIIEPLDRGGSGIVYSAYDPELERRVAIKLLMAPRSAREGSSRSGSERLLREAQALARLSHPNVIAVHDVGTYEIDQAHLGPQDSIAAGGVFIVMELVDGQRLDRWGRQTPRRRSELLDMLIQAGRGLEAAHAAGLVHRDFKPANVLVDTQGRARVLDFGLARTSAPEVMDENASPGLLNDDVTETGYQAGTPRYMAPEQHEHGPVDARADVYAFCVTVYELLCGRPPFEGETWGELFEAKKAMDFERPARSVMPGWLWRTLLAGMASDPARRSTDMTKLLAALGRGRRQRHLVAGALGAVLLGSSIVLGSSTPHCIELDRELAGAWDSEVSGRVEGAFSSTALPFAEQSYRSVAAELDQWSRRWLDSRRSHCEAQRDDPTSGSYGPWLVCLERQRAQLAGLTRLLEQADPATVEVAVHSVGELGDPESCSTHRRSPGVHDEPGPELLVPLAEVRALLATHKHEQAETISRQLVRRARERGLVAQQAEALLLHARSLTHLDRLEEAKARAELAIARAEQVFDAALSCEAAVLLVEISTATGELSTADAIAWMTRSRLEAQEVGTRVAAQLASSTGALRLQQGRREDAVTELKRALELERSRQGADPLELAPIFERLGRALLATGRTDDATEALERAREIYQTALGPHHPFLASLYDALAQVQMKDGELELATETLVRARALISTSYDPLAESKVLHHFAQLHHARGEYAEAMEKLEQGTSILLQRRAPSHPSVLRMRALRAQLLTTQGFQRDAADELEELLPLQQQILGHHHRDTIRTMLVLGAQLAGLGEDRRARELLLSAVARTEAEEGSDSRRSAAVRLALARDYARTNELDEAERLLRSSASFYDEEVTPSPMAFQASLDLASIHYLRRDRVKEVEELTRTLARARRIFGPEHLRMAKPYLFRGRALQARGEHARARADLERAVELGERAPWPPLLDLHARYALAVSWVHEDPQRAQSWIEEARERLAEHPDPSQSEPLKHGIGELRQALEAWPRVLPEYALDY